MDSNARPPHTASTMSIPPPAPLNLQALRSLDEGGFVARIGPVVEHSPWVARRVWIHRPFGTRKALFDALCAEIHGASDDEQLALLRVHPELAGQEARAGTMTTDSQSEQGRLGLLRLDATTVRRLDDLNRRYRERFGFPFIVALRLHATLDSVLADGEQRLRHDATAERRIALGQVCQVVLGRLERLVDDDAVSPLPPSQPTPAGASS